MVASIGPYTFLFFALMNVCFWPIMYVFYPETGGRSLPEIDVLFAHAHLSKRRPTLVADEMPPLNDNQVDILQERYNIHGNEEDLETGANGEVDLSIPHPDAHKNDHHVIRHGSGDSTRVPSFSEQGQAGGGNSQVARGEKNVV